MNSEALERNPSVGVSGALLGCNTVTRAGYLSYANRALHGRVRASAFARLIWKHVIGKKVFRYGLWLFIR